MSSSALPAPGNLPSWSRVSAMDRSRYPRPFLRDHLPQGGTGELDTSSVDVRFLEKMTQSVHHRLVNHDKAIKYVQEQHSETLQKLHQELETLKKENKELKFRVVVAQSSDSPSETPEYRTQSVPSDIKTILLQEEIKDLQQALKDTKNKNTQLRKAVFSVQSRTEQKNEMKKDESSHTDVTTEKTHRRRLSISNLSMSLPLHATLNPLQIRDSVDGVPRVPSMAECEYIIQHLYNINHQQLTRLSRLRGDSLSVPSSRNSTPEPVTKSLADTAPTVAITKLPRIPMRPKMRKPIHSSSAIEMGDPLPLVVNSLSAGIVESRKRRNKTDRNESGHRK